MEKESVRIFQQNGEVHPSCSTLLSMPKRRRLGLARCWHAPEMALDAEQVAQVDNRHHEGTGLFLPSAA